MQEILTTGITVIIALAFALYLVPRLNIIYAKAGIKVKNYKGREITPSLGPAIPLALVPALAWLSLWMPGGSGIGSDSGSGIGGGITAVAAGAARLSSPALLLALLVAGMCMAGLLDDILNEKTRGFRGHLRSVRKGNLTAGMVKAAWGAMLALLVVLQTDILTGSSLTLFPGFTLTGPPALMFIAEKAAALLTILLWTNGINLLDRRPGRALKAFMFAGLFLAFAGAALNPYNRSCIFAAPEEGAVTFPPPGAGDIYTTISGAGQINGAGQQGEIMLLLPLLVIAMALMPPDLAGRAMLGDAGSNPLGAALGLYALFVLPFGGLLLFLLLGLSLNIAGEFVSLTEVIERNRFLSFLDRLGTERTESGSKRSEKNGKGGHRHDPKT